MPLARPAPRRFLRRALIPLLLMAAIAVLSHQPLPVSLPRGGDKLAHLLVFGALAAAWHHALLATRLSRPQAALVALLVSAAWGVLDEWHQSFVPGRYASAGDAIADLAGVMLAVGLAHRARRGRRA